MTTFASCIFELKLEWLQFAILRSFFKIQMYHENSLLVSFIIDIDDAVLTIFRKILRIILWCLLSFDWAAIATQEGGRNTPNLSNH